MKNFHIEELINITNHIHILSGKIIFLAIKRSPDPIFALFYVLMVFIVGIGTTIIAVWGIWFSIFFIGWKFVNMLEDLPYLWLGLLSCTILSVYTIGYGSSIITRLLN